MILRENSNYVLQTLLNIRLISMHFTVDGAIIDGLECVHFKYNSRASTARELLDKYTGFCRLKHCC